MMLMLLVINETIWSIQVLGSTSAIVDVNSFLAHYGAATKVDLGSFDPVSSLPIGPNTVLAAFVVDVIFMHVGAWNMTRQLDPASLVLQADCGCCTYHRPQNGNTTRRRVDVAAAAASAASIYSLSVLVSCFLFFFLLLRHLFVSSAFVPAFLPLHHLHQLLLPRLSVYFSFSSATVTLARTHTHRHVHTLTHLSVICMR